MEAGPSSMLSEVLRGDRPDPAPKDVRTNSLGYASTSCHTCVLKDVVCDRQRPRCGTCLSKGRTCGGFAIPLSWDNRRIWVGQSAQDTASREHDGTCAVPEPNARRHTSRERSGYIFRFFDPSARTSKRRRVETTPADNPDEITSDSLLGAAVPTAPSTDPFVQEESAGMTEEISGHREAESALCEENRPSSKMTTTTATTETTGTTATTATTATTTHPLPDSIATTTLDNALITAGHFDSNSRDSWDNLPVLNESLTHSTMADAESLFPDCIASAANVVRTRDSWDNLPVLDESFTHSTMADFEILFPDWIASTANVVRTPSPMRIGVGTMADDHILLLERCQSQYDTEFSVMPLTGDTSTNPFRSRRQAWQTSSLLLHAILALCCQHHDYLTGTSSERVCHYREQATKLLEDESSSEVEPSRMSLELLDPILVIFTLDCMLSAKGNWAQHLRRARRLLETSGGPISLITPMLRSQVGMLIWWDITLAMISRRGLVIDIKYVEHVTSHEARDPWSFFDLTGCPGELVSLLAELVELAKQRELAATMTWLTFNPTPVLEIEKTLKQWRNTEPRTPTFTDESHQAEFRDAVNDTTLEEQYQHQHDRYHCAEAWRCTLLLYIRRAFLWDRQSLPQMAIKQLARETLDHIRCCRRTSQTQKQLLLPIFLSASETRDGELRQVARNYCSWWSNRSRYNMFNSVPILLERLWAEEAQDPQSWWGSIIDDETSRSDADNPGCQFLFG